MLQIRLLGQFDVRLDGKRILIPSRAGQSLLAYLVLTAGTSHRREKLAGILWPDFSDENARKNLRHELWRIRKAISTQQPTTVDYLLAEEFTIAFNREAEYWLDAAQMERPELDLGSLISNLSLYQGELLPGFYEDWIVLERERIRVIFDTKMEQLLGQLIAAERWTAVQEQAERWLSLGNTLEPAYRALMLAYGVRGDMAKVSSIYQRCIEQLNEQFGLEPSAETRALYDGLLKGAHIPSSAVQSSGTITFLFTDIEESTNLLDKLGDQYATLLAEHHEILRAAIQKRNGREVDTQGDAFFITFARSLDAVRCACEAQRALASHSWLHNQPLRVRMGLHTGEPLIASTGYVGMDVHRAARIGDAAHGGQVLLSQTTRELVIHDLPKGVTIRDLGEHRLKDLKFPTPIYQLVIEGLSYNFPPLRTKFSGSEAPTQGEAPFKGLQFFDEGDSDLFFGREILTAKLVHRLQNANFLSVIIGASGSGKSSLVRAGLVPAIKKGSTLINGAKPPEGSVGWQIHTITPTAHPLEALAIELTRESESVTATATLVDDLSKDPRSLHFFLSRRSQSPRTFLVVDQFEELFTLCRDEFEREAFIDNLLAALTPAPLPLGETRKNEGRITLILTLRADFYAHLAQYPELRDAVAQQQEYIGPMTTEELRRAIEEPAKRGHWVFEAGLVDLILRDVGDEPGALPLLSHALLETWQRRAGHTLTLKGYADAGGVRGAIAHTAESVFQTLSLSEQVIMRNILLRLTEFGEGTEDTRRRASFNELMSQASDADEVRAVLNKLAEARLVTLSEDQAEVAHEALIREWPHLREWLSQDREGIILHRHLTEAAHEWELLERDAGSVYRGARLAQANEWSALNPNVLNAQERLFLDASNRQAKQEEQEREDQLQRERDVAVELAETQRQSASRLRIRNRVIATVGSIAVILALLAGMFGFQSNQNAITSQNNAATAQFNEQSRATQQALAEAESLRAENEKQIAFSRELAAAALSNLHVDPERSILLALQAVSTTYSLDKSVLPEAEDALHRAVQVSRIEFTLRGHSGGVWEATFSSDGTRLATASADGTAKVWDAVTSQELLTLKGHTEGGVNGVAFSADGKLLATGGDDKTARVWDTVTGQALFTLKGHSDFVIHVAFSPDGRHLATTSIDGTAKVWDVVTGQELLTLSGHTDGVVWVVFSPDGTRFATASLDGTASVWDVVTGKKLITLSGHTDGVTSVAFSPDGTRLATTSADRTAKIWNAHTGEVLLTLHGHTEDVNDVAFSPDGTRLATTSYDRQVKVWEATTGQELFALAGHSDGVMSVAFSPEGTHVVTASHDKTVKVWSVSPSKEFLTLVNGPATTSRAAPWLTYSPDGTRLAASNADATPRVWDATTGKLLFHLLGHTDVVRGITFSPDGTRIATASADRTAKVWDAVTGKERLALSGGHTDIVFGIAFSPDGTRLATASTDKTAKVWDATNGKELITLSGHTDWVVDIAFSPDGTRLATASADKTAKVWDATNGKELFTLTGHSDLVRQVVFNSDGTRLATASYDGTSKVWDAVTGKELLTLTGHASLVFGVAFSPDGTRLATASTDRMAKVWDAVTGKELLTLYGHTSGVTSLAFSPDGSHLATASFDGTDRVYFLRIEDLVTLAKQRVTRLLTTEECQQYLHVEACPAEP